MSLFTPLGRSVRVAAVMLVLAAPLAAAPVSAAGLFGMGNDQGSQDSQATAALTLRVQSLEQQVRDLTGQVQGLTFQMTQLQAVIDRMNQDNDFRFKALEGGKGGAPAKSSSVEPSQDAPAGSDAAPLPTKLRAGAQLASAAPLGAGASASAGDGLGGSMDPLVGKGKAGVAPGTDEVPLGPSNGQATDANPAGATDDDTPATAPSTPAPLKLASTGGAAAGNPQAQAEYKTGYNSIVKGDYAGAADKFKDFIKQYPDDPQAADATNWLGEALLQQQDYVDAADVLVTGYKTYPTSPRAPDMLLKLGIALAGADQQDAACKTFNLLSTKYPNTTTAFRTRLKQELARGKCPA